MAVDVDISFVQSNDGVTIKITDTTGAYHAVDNTDGWGSPNDAVASIVAGSDVTNPGSERHLLLDLTVTPADGTAVTYTQINLYDHDSTGPFSDVDDLVWEFNPADFLSSGTAMGESDEAFIDGVYQWTYSLVHNDDHSTVVSSVEYTTIIDAQVRTKLYDKIRDVAIRYSDTDESLSVYHPEMREILDTFLKKGLYDGMVADNEWASINDVVDMLSILEELTEND